MCLNAAGTASGLRWRLSKQSTCSNVSSTLDDRSRRRVSSVADWQTTCTASRPLRLYVTHQSTVSHCNHSGRCLNHATSPFCQRRPAVSMHHAVTEKHLSVQTDAAVGNRRLTSNCCTPHVHYTALVHIHRTQTASFIKIKTSDISSSAIIKLHFSAAFSWATLTSMCTTCMPVVWRCL